MQQDLILVLNLNDAASLEAARKLRAERICCRIVPGCYTSEQIRELSPKGIILASDTDGNRNEEFDSRILRENIPILAWGASACQVLSMAGGSVGEELTDARFLSLEFRKSVLTEGIADQERMIRRVFRIETGGCMTPICVSGETVIGYSHDILPIYGIQLDVEQNDPDGAMIMRNFALDVCGCTAWWDDEAYVDSQVQEICTRAGEGSVMCAVTGGLDSAVCAALAHRAVGERLTCILIDTGLMREGECARFINTFGNGMGIGIRLIDASEDFLDALRGITDQKEKLRIIGRKLREILIREMESFPDLKLLIRGTNCSDVMLKSFDHVPDDLPVPTFEPVRELFKNEIRRVAGYLGFPAEYTAAQPFPGTGLALRIRGEVNRESLAVLREADRIFNEELQNAGVKRLMKSFAAMESLPDAAGKVIWLRAVQSAESLSANIARLPYDTLENTVRRIMNEVQGVQRVLYDLTNAETMEQIEYNSL